MNINQKIQCKAMLENVKSELKTLWGWSDKQFIKYTYYSYSNMFFSCNNVQKLSKRARRNLI